MSKNTASEKRLKTTEQSGNVTTTAIGDRFKKIQKKGEKVRTTQPQPTDSRQQKRSQDSQANAATAN